MVNRPPNLVGRTAHLDGRHGTVTRWAAQPDAWMVEVDWADGTRSWHRWHDVHGPADEPAPACEQFTSSAPKARRTRKKG